MLMNVIDKIHIKNFPCGSRDGNSSFVFLFVCFFAKCVSVSVCKRRCKELEKRKGFFIAHFDLCVLDDAVRGSSL